MSKNKFEEMLERLVNEDREGAEALFHEIVVERSREIYQSILESEDEDDLDEASEDDDDELDEADDEDLDEADDDEELDESADEDEDEDLDEMFGLDEFEMEADPMGGDTTDDMMGDVSMDDEGGDEMGMDMDDEGGDDTDDRLMDLEDALDELRAEFEAMMGGEGDDEEGDEEGDDEEGGEGEMNFGDEEGDEEDDEKSKESFTYEAKKPMKKDDKKDDKKAKKTAGEEMREYVEKVNGGFGAKIGGDNGTNSKSIVASKNDMGGTTANILRTDTENSGEANKGQLKGSSLFKGTAKEDNAGNMNVPGAKAGKTAFKKSEPGHGAEKKGKPETADKGAHSTIRGVVRTK
jgi:hypothetical protein